MLSTPSHAPMWIEESVPARWGASAEEVAAALEAQVLDHCERSKVAPRVIRVRLGSRIAFTDEELVRALSRIVKGTPLAHATLKIERIPARWFCPECDRTLHSKRCRTCDVAGVLEAGEEMVLDAMEG